MTQQAWTTSVARIVGGEVKRYRRARGLTAQQLAEQCAELGHPITRNVIASLEIGRRPVGLVELIVLARALNVAPVLLVAPVGYQETVEILPGREASAYGAAEWFSGAADLVDDESGSGEPSLLAQGLPPGASSLQLYREYVQVATRQYLTLEALKNAVLRDRATDQRWDVTQADARRLHELMEQGSKFIDSLRRRIAERGLIQPPDLDALVTEGPDGAEVQSVFQDLSPGTGPVG